MMQSSRLVVRSRFCAREMATTSECRVTSCSWATRLIDSLTTWSALRITTPYGYSPSSADLTESAMQRVIILLSLASVCGLLMSGASRGRISLANRVKSRIDRDFTSNPASPYHARLSRVALPDDSKAESQNSRCDDGTRDLGRPSAS